MIKAFMTKAHAHLLKGDLGCLLSREATADVKKVKVVASCLTHIKHSTCRGNSCREGSWIIAATSHMETVNKYNRYRSKVSVFISMQLKHSGWTIECYNFKMWITHLTPTTLRPRSLAVLRSLGTFLMSAPYFMPSWHWDLESSGGRIRTTNLPSKGNYNKPLLNMCTAVMLNPYPPRTLPANPYFISLWKLPVKASLALYWNVFCIKSWTFYL